LRERERERERERDLICAVLYEYVQMLQAQNPEQSKNFNCSQGREIHKQSLPQRCLHIRPSKAGQIHLLSILLCCWTTPFLD